VRHLCHAAPGRAAAIASTSPRWASEMTSRTPARPRAVNERRNPSQPAPSSSLATSRSSTSRCPSPLTPTAISACTLTVRPPSRTLTVNASHHTNVYGPASSGRLRNASTCASRYCAISETCDLDRRAMPSCSTSFSSRRVDTPSRYAVATTETRACSARRRCCSNQSGKYEPDRSFGIASSTVPARVSHSRGRYPITGPHAPSGTDASPSTPSGTDRSQLPLRIAEISRVRLTLHNQAQRATTSRVSAKPHLTCANGLRNDPASRSVSDP
jgi:hypothetical protein